MTRETIDVPFPRLLSKFFINRLILYISMCLSSIFPKWLANGPWIRFSTLNTSTGFTYFNLSYSFTLPIAFFSILNRTTMRFIATISTICTIYVYHLLFMTLTNFVFFMMIMIHHHIIFKTVWIVQRVGHRTTEKVFQLLYELFTIIHVYFFPG